MSAPIPDNLALMWANIIHYSTLTSEEPVMFNSAPALPLDPRDAGREAFRSFASPSDNPFVGIDWAEQRWTLGYRMQSLDTLRR